MTHLAVIDVETTGLNPYRHDRIIELAVLRMSVDGGVDREFATLINPERDIGPTNIHGLTASDIIDAPRFAEVAGPLLDILSGCVALAGHNVRFDHSFLASEFSRLGFTFPFGPTVCTMQLSGGGALSSCCDDYGISFTGTRHTALADARATAQLFAAILQDAPSEVSKLNSLSPMIWPYLPLTAAKLITRDESRNRQAQPPTYIQKLCTKAESDLVPSSDNSAVLAYTALLNRALEDRYIDDTEANSLLDVASQWGIVGDQAKKIHRNYLLQLASVALGDGIITESERNDLHKVAHLLGSSPVELDEIIEKASKTLSPAQRATRPVLQPTGRDQLLGKTVCFTGELQCRLAGEPITRTMATKLALGRGLNVVESVTKKLDLLVVADPLTQSGKAKKVRKYGIRIMQENVFWNALGIEVG